MATSDAVSLGFVSKVTGYKVLKGNFSATTPNLPMKIAILAEANTAVQGDIDFTEPFPFTTAQQVGVKFGFGSPAYMTARILRPVSGVGVGDIPTVIYPQEEASGATARVVEIEATGTATGNATHTVIVAGRGILDGIPYDYTVNTGDTPTIIHGKISDAINAVLACPFSATDTATEVTATTKWKGLTAQEVTISIETYGNAVGVTYSVTQTTAGAGTPSVQASLESFGNEWIPIVINTYGTVSSVMTALEDFNGIPSETPTGRYSGIIWKPFIALTGSVDENPSNITDTRSADVTIAICPAPLSLGHPAEAAANVGLLLGVQAQNTPELDISGQAYPDMPTPSAIGEMSIYVNRDTIVKKGCSTIELVNGAYQMVDFVTTYHPDGETPPQFRYVRSLIQDFNFKFAWFLDDQKYVVDHVIALDGAPVQSSKVITPNLRKQIAGKTAKDLERRGIIVDAAFTLSGTIVNIGDTNPDRLETQTRYKRSGYGRISSTTVYAGFNTNS